MILFTYDVPVMLIMGYFFGWLFAKKLYHQNQFYIVTLFGLTVLFWLKALLSNLSVLTLWFTPAFTVETDSLIIGLSYVLSYPLWFAWASRLFGSIWGKTPYQNGLIWLAGHGERAKPFEPSWKSGDTETGI